MKKEKKEGKRWRLRNRGGGPQEKKEWDKKKEEDERRGKERQ